MSDSHMERIRRREIWEKEQEKKILSLNLIRKYKNGQNVCYEYMTDDELKYEILKRLLIKLIKKEIDEETFLRLKRKLE